MNISVFGLGKLGLCTAALFAAAGYKVKGYDVSGETINALQKGKITVREPQLETLLDNAGPNISFHADANEALNGTEFTCVIVPTPSDEAGRFSNRFIISALETIGQWLAEQKHFHVIDVISTVMPGSSDRHFRPLLETTSGKMCGADFGLVYNPEFIALGSVIRDFLYPDFVLIGASDERSAKMTKSMYLDTCENTPPIELMSLLNAEITKISLNTFVTMKISFVNELANICDRLPGANIDSVTHALGLDSRIGSKYLHVGMGFGGPCFPRDGIAFQRMAEDADCECFFPAATKQVNDSIVPALVERVKQKGVPEKPVSILGLSYKPGTHIIEESQPIQTAQALCGMGYDVILHDPQALDEARIIMGDSVQYAADMREGLDQAGTILLLMPWPEYEKFNWRDYDTSTLEKKVLFDPWRVLPSNGLTHIDVVHSSCVSFSP